MSDEKKPRWALAWVTVSVLVCCVSCLAIPSLRMISAAILIGYLAAVELALNWSISRDWIAGKSSDRQKP